MDAKKICIVFTCTFGDTIIFENLGVEYLSAYMKKNGWDVMIANLNYEEDIYKRISEFNPIIIGCSVMTETIGELTRLCQSLIEKKVTAKYIFGGPGATAEPELLLKTFSFIDAAVIGEGEITLLELSERLFNNQSLIGVKGAYCNENGEINKGEMRPLISDMDTLPIPHHFTFLNSRGSTEIFKYMAVSSARGCGGNCGFCYKTFNKQPGKKFRYKSTETFVSEIEYFNQEHGINRFAFIDQTFEDPGKIGKKRILDIAEAIIKRKLDIIFTVHIRTENYHMDDQNIINTLKKAGLIGVFPGLETGTDRGLKIFNKPSTIDDHKRTIKLFRNNNLLIDIGWINFHPYITLEDLLINVKFLQDIQFGHLAHILYNKLIAFPCTLITKKMIGDNLFLEKPSFLNIDSLTRYKYIDSDVEKIDRIFFIENKLSEQRKIAQKIYKFCLDWEFLDSLLTIKYTKYEVLENIIYNIRQEKTRLFSILQEININRFLKYIELAKEGWNTEKQQAIEKEFSYDCLLEGFNKLATVRMKLLYKMEKNNIKDYFSLV